MGFRDMLRGILRYYTKMIFGKGENAKNQDVLLFRHHFLDVDEDSVWCHLICKLQILIVL